MVSKFTRILTLILATSFMPDISFADGMPENTKVNKDSSGSESDAGKHSPSVGPKVENGKSDEVKKKLPAYSLLDEELLKYQYCGKDSDCMQVVNGCCQCMQGDPVTAINKKHISEFERRFNCGNVKCPLDSESHRCMDGVVSCINFRCTYFPPE